MLKSKKKWKEHLTKKGKGTVKTKIARQTKKKEMTNDAKKCTKTTTKKKKHKAKGNINKARKEKERERTKDRANKEKI